MPTGPATTAGSTPITRAADTELEPAIWNAAIAVTATNSVPACAPHQRIGRLGATR